MNATGHSRARTISASPLTALPLWTLRQQIPIYFEVEILRIISSVYLSCLYTEQAYDMGLFTYMKLKKVTYALTDLFKGKNYEALPNE